jgi:hypothetical protein
MRLNPEQLSQTFVELADSLVTDFDVIDFLHLLAIRCTELLDVTAVGVMLADHAGDLRVVAASNEQIRLLELFQLQNDQGPCLDCFRAGQPVSAVEFTAIQARWPRFAVQARELGFGAVQAFPMRLRHNVIGALNLFSATPGLGPADTQVAQALADVATIGLLQQRAHRHADTVVVQLQTALNSRVIIEQAKGVISERLTVDMHTAFTILRNRAGGTHRQLADVAQAVITGTEDITAPSTNQDRP